MRVHRASVLCSAAMLIVAATPIRGQGQTPESVEAIHRWVTLVREHVPGRPDASVQAMTSMTYSARRTLNGAFPPFIRILRDPEALVTRSEPEKQLASVARTARLRIGAGAFLKRAAMLHADAVVFESRFPPPSDDAPPRVPPQRDATAGRRSIPLPPVPPLLTSDRVTLTRDGELLGDAPLNWHLPFARSLLEELRKLAEPEGADACAEARAVPELARQPCIQVDLSRVSAEDAAFIAQWYHAVTAYLFARGMNGDANFHLREAQRVLPNDPQVVFDRASYAETFGLPLYQAVIEAAGGARVDVIPAEEKTNEEAERLYRRALEMDASFVEARIRLARLLDHRGRRDDAAAHIARALEERPSGAVRFYALIVAGRIAAGRGRHDDALRHYRDAAAMYPDAQSALLGASHAALMLANVPQTLAQLADLGAAAPNRGADPWPEYHLGSGRDVNELFDALWASFSK